ncbi:GNAT family N-acetyltransferase [Thiocystis violascens]|uniref:Putative acetyltransferase n=1 Tax=Thiocystis violascens (strain ATCC 17096 / DSM 198 / 6111) TaxID=765911 RepID=I3YC24_THIV6|nr:N-acetyltransferase [Thiocystis violascens]AFL74542.1 putative acetyltransferase [Thiocystis violascens DSM 198]
MQIQIRQTTNAETPAICDLIEAAFGDEQGLEVAQLTRDLLADPSAQPLLSLVATAQRTEIGDPPLGHILFTHAKIHTGSAPSDPIPSAAILAPLAVRSDVQSQGIGGRLIADGLARLTAAGVDLVFVLGHPGYYSRHGFVPAGNLGLDAPYPIPPEHADAWMVQALRQGLLGRVQGQVACAEALDDPRHWRE